MSCSSRRPRLVCSFGLRFLWFPSYPIVVRQDFRVLIIVHVRSSSDYATFVNDSSPRLQTQMNKWTIHFVMNCVTCVMFRQSVRTYDDATSIPTSNDTVIIRLQVKTRRRIQVNGTKRWSTFRAFSNTLFMGFRRITTIYVVTRMKRLFVNIMIVISRSSVIRLMLLNLLFRPVSVLKRMFAFGSCSSICPIIMFLARHLRALRMTKRLLKRRPRINCMINSMFPKDVI